jgi:uncharacterized protein YecE (DUF72 family)
MTRFRVGIGGWTFAPWRGVFYPGDLTQKRQLEFASRKLTSIEINGTFYGAQKPGSFRRWASETPEGFVFSVKGPRFVTHRRDLGEAGPSIERFFSSGVIELGDKLGPVLWQFAPFTRFDEAGFQAFLELLPGTVAGRTIRHVVEVRHESFADPRFTALLRRHNVAQALIDSEKDPLASHEATADFVYARLKRAEEDIATGYASAALEDWAERLRRIAKGGDCFVYFINGAKIRAPAAAAAFIAILGR